MASKNIIVHGKVKISRWRTTYLWVFREGQWMGKLAEAYQNPLGSRRKVSRQNYCFSAGEFSKVAENRCFGWEIFLGFYRGFLISPANFLQANFFFVQINLFYFVDEFPFYI